MVATNVGSNSTRIAVAGVVAFTAAGFLLAAVDPELDASGRPHPTLTGSLDGALWILQNNARVLCVPFLLCLLGFPVSRPGRVAGDVFVAALAATSAIPVGVELGRWHARLLRYLPHLPVEWAALTVAIHAWLIARHKHASARQLARHAVLTLALLAAAASLETWATPHKTSTPQPGKARQPQALSLSWSLDPVSGDRWWLPAPECAPGRPGRFKVAFASFPSLRSVPLGRQPAPFWLCQPPRIPNKEETKCSIA